MASYESYPQPEKPQKDDGKKKLKTILCIALIALLVVAAIVGVTVWRGSTLPSARQTDTEALTQSSAGLNETKFKAVKVSEVPSYKKLYGKTPKELEKLGPTLTFGALKKVDGEAFPTDGTVDKKIRYSVNARLKKQKGVELEVFFDKDKKSVAAAYTYDLDELNVAEADFSVFAADKTVPSSLLSSIGLSKSVASKKAHGAKDASPVISVSSAKSTCTYKGATGEKLKKVTHKKKVYNKKKHKKVTKKVVKKVQVSYMDWELVESYEYASGDNATMRSAKISLY